MNKFKKILSRLLMSIGALSLILGGYFYSTSGYITDKVSSDTIRLTGKVDLLLDENAFLHDDFGNKFLFDLERYLKSNVKYINVPSMFKSPIRYFDTELVILVSSNGGSVDILFKMLKLFKLVKRKGLKVKCYVGNAKSAAFTFLVAACDTRIMLKGAELGQHPSYFRSRLGKVYTTSTKYYSIKMSDIEAEALRIDKKEWYEFTRVEDKNTNFTEKEALEYGIVHEVIGE